jgi:hypothetical protein
MLVQVVSIVCAELSHLFEGGYCEIASFDTLNTSQVRKEPLDLCSMRNNGQQLDCKCFHWMLLLRNTQTLPPCLSISLSPLKWAFAVVVLFQILQE